MNRLRRQNRDSRFQPVAAEVLEMRSLLSATVHAAVAHAQHEVHAAAKPAAPVIRFPATYEAIINVNGTIQGQPVGINDLHFLGTFHGASATAQAGKKVKIGINEPAINLEVGGVTVNSVKGAIQGKVLSFVTGVDQLTILPSGHLTVTMTVAGQTVKATVSASSQNRILLDATGFGTSVNPYEFASLSATYLITKPTGATGTVDFILSPEPI